MRFLLVGGVISGALAYFVVLLPRPDPSQKLRIVRQKRIGVLVSETTAPILLGELPPTPPPATPPPPDSKPVPDARTLSELEEERRNLQASLQRIREDTEQRIAQLPKNLPPVMPPQAPMSLNPTTVRELDFSGHPTEVVRQIMTRYDMRVVHKYVAAASPETFLSSAALGPTDRYYANRAVPPGVYDVFELSPKAIRRMAELEEAELARRGLGKRSLVRYVKFGVVLNPGGSPDLGILAFDAAEVP